MAKKKSKKKTKAPAGADATAAVDDADAVSSNSSGHEGSDAELDTADAVGSGEHDAAAAAGSDGEKFEDAPDATADSLRVDASAAGDDATSATGADAGSDGSLGSVGNPAGTPPAENSPVTSPVRSPAALPADPGPGLLAPAGSDAAALLHDVGDDSEPFPVPASNEAAPDAPGAAFVTERDEDAAHTGGRELSESGSRGDAQGREVSSGAKELQARSSAGTAGAGRPTVDEALAGLGERAAAAGSLPQDASSFVRRVKNAPAAGSAATKVDLRVPSSVQASEDDAAAGDAAADEHAPLLSGPANGAAAPGGQAPGVAAPANPINWKKVLLSPFSRSGQQIGYAVELATASAFFAMIALERDTHLVAKNGLQIIGGVYAVVAGLRAIQPIYQRDRLPGQREAGFGLERGYMPRMVGNLAVAASLGMSVFSGLPSHYAQNETRVKEACGVVIAGFAIIALQRAVLTFANHDTSHKALKRIDWAEVAGFVAGAVAISIFCFGDADNNAQKIATGTLSGLASLSLLAPCAKRVMMAVGVGDVNVAHLPATYHV